MRAFQISKPFGRKSNIDKRKFSNYHKNNDAFQCWTYVTNFLILPLSTVTLVMDSAGLAQEFSQWMHWQNARGESCISAEKSIINAFWRVGLHFRFHDIIRILYKSESLIKERYSPQKSHLLFDCWPKLYVVQHTSICLANTTFRIKHWMLWADFVK